MVVVAQGQMGGRARKGGASCRVQREALSEQMDTDCGTQGTTGTFSINGKGKTTNMNVGQPVPGPLPLLAAGSAFGLSRRLRRRFALSPAPGEG